ncbi:hypothetical protein AB0A63_31690 [Lentzea sp. NPDC042327]|uniref:hypothetical protein n=1 Tax=Lentzea sp. NPDC042327 TaxID=3154801 RepID=UPI003406744B
MTTTFLTAAELDELLGPGAADWPGLGLTVVRGTPAEPESLSEVTVRKGEEIVGFTEQSTAYKGLRIYQALITTGHRGVPFPAGFLPPDPLRARHNERLRWLPEDHPDRPAEGTVRQNAHIEA